MTKPLSILVRLAFFRTILGTIILAVIVAVVTWHIEKASHPRVALTSSTTMPKVIVPARVIPADVNQNMQAALEAREQNLAQLAKGK